MTELIFDHETNIEASLQIKKKEKSIYKNVVYIYKALNQRADNFFLHEWVGLWQQHPNHVTIIKMYVFLVTWDYNVVPFVKTQFLLDVMAGQKRQSRLITKAKWINLKF